MREGWRGMVEGNFQPLGPAEIWGCCLAAARSSAAPARTRTSRRRRGARVRAFDEPRRARRDRRRGHARRGRACYDEHGSRSSASPRRSTTTSPATDYTFGFGTAVCVATEAIDRLHTTAESHNRVMVVEVMGRHAGWIAVMRGIAGGADVILIPERQVDHRAGLRGGSAPAPPRQGLLVVVVSEGFELPGAEDEGEVDERPQAAGQAGRRRAAGEGIEAHTGSRAGHRARPASAAAPPRVRSLAGHAVRPQGRRSWSPGKFGRMAALTATMVVDVSLPGRARAEDSCPRTGTVARAFFG